MFGSIAAALGMAADAVAEGLYAQRHGFAARAAAVGYLIGAVLAWFVGAVTPVTFTVESVTVATQAVKERPLILWVVALSAVPSILLGVFGLYSTLVEVLNPAVLAGAIAGVGLILAKVGVSYVRDQPQTGGPSIVAGLAAYFLTGNLVVVIIASLVVGSLAARLVPDRWLSDEEEAESGDEDHDEEPAVEFPRIRPKSLLNRSVLIGAFSVFALRTGAVVSYANVNASLAGQDVSPNLDGVTLMAGLGSLASALAGGPPIETTPAPMAAADMPVFSTILFMVAAAVVSGAGLIAKIGRYLPLQAIAGFLFVLGIPVVIPENLPALTEAPVPGAVALGVTAFSNPFYGILAGEAIDLVMAAGFTP